MQLSLNEFVEVLGQSTKSNNLQDLFKKFKLAQPHLEKDEEAAWLENQELGFQLAFVDEEEIKSNQYSDIGDGELIFITALFNRLDILELPYDILITDSQKDIEKKIGRRCDRELSFLRRSSWLFDDLSKGLYVLFFEYSDDHEEIIRAGITYSYGQIEWVNELKNKK